MSSPEPEDPALVSLRAHGPREAPTLVYLPGLHGDWTLIASFRAALEGRVRFVELTYPRTTTWTLSDYAAAVDTALQGARVTEGWLLAESFGSQVAWALLSQRAAGFGVQGLILAGGFVRHPAPALVAAGRRLLVGCPAWFMTGFLACYRRFAWFRHRRARETYLEVPEFVARRTPADLRAMVQRLDLIVRSDWRSRAAVVSLPVYFLAGILDPVVPWPPVRRWLRRHCPGYRGSRILSPADHNVLGTAPRAAAAQVLAWMKGAGRAPAADRAPGQMH